MGLFEWAALQVAAISIALKAATELRSISVIQYMLTAGGLSAYQTSWQVLQIYNQMSFTFYFTHFDPTTLRLPYS